MYHRPTPTSAANEGRELYHEVHKHVLSSLDVPKDSDVSSDPIIAIKDLKYLGSYNWTEASQPTIIVPGSPREWLDKPLPFQVPIDQNLAYIDQNSYRMGKASLAPLIQSVEAIIVDEDKPDFDWLSVDFVSDRNGLRKLLRWTSSSASKPCDDFRIDTQFVGKKTILLNRWEAKNKEDHKGERSSYARNFEKVMTANAASSGPAGTGHHRIVTYDLNGLRMVVRFVVDGCVPQERPTKKAAVDATGNDDDLAALVEGLSIGESSTKRQTPARTPELKITWGGTEIPQSSLIETKTRSVMSVKSFDWTDIYPQLYLSQTPHLYIAVHKRGMFSEVRKEQIGQGNLVKVAKDAQMGLKKLRNALGTIRVLVQKHGLGGRISLICKDGKLKVYGRSNPESCLPENLITLFDEK